MRAYIVGFTKVAKFKDVKGLPILRIPKEEMRKLYGVTLKDDIILQFRGHHTVLEKLYTIESMRALERKGLFDVLNFRQNGLALPFLRDVLSRADQGEVSENAATAMAVHRTRHDEYSDFVKTVIPPLNKYYKSQQFAALPTDTQKAWLVEKGKTIRGLASYLRAALLDPSKPEVLHDADAPDMRPEDEARSKIRFLWDGVTDQWDEENFCFRPDSEIAQSPFFQVGGEIAPGFLDLSGIHNLVINGKRLDAFASKAALDKALDEAGGQIPVEVPDQATLVAEFARCEHKLSYFEHTIRTFRDCTGFLTSFFQKAAMIPVVMTSAWQPMAQNQTPSRDLLSPPQHWELPEPIRRSSLPFVTFSKEIADSPTAMSKEAPLQYISSLTTQRDHITEAPPASDAEGFERDLG